MKASESVSRLGCKPFALQDIEDASGAPVSTPAKRKCVGNEDASSPAAKAQKTEFTTIPCAEVTGHILSTIQMISMRATTSPVLSFRVGHKVYVLNNGTEPLNITKGALICAFGRGSFKHRKPTDTLNPDKELLYELANNKTEILVNNTWTTVGSALSEKRKDIPTAELNYHELVPMEGENFALKFKHQIVFQPNSQQQTQEDETGGLASLQASAGALVQFSKWNNKFTKIVWSCNWKAKRESFCIRQKRALH